MTRRDALATLGVAAAGAAVAADPPKTTPDILMLVYPGFTALDLVGPHHVLSLVPGYRVRLVAKTAAKVTSDLGLTFEPTAFADCPERPAVVFVPGGTDGTLAAMEDAATRDFLASRGAHARFVTSVCTGSLVLAAAGLLKGYKATSHWLTRDRLAKLGAVPTDGRVVADRTRLTGGGVTAGIDFGLVLAARLADEPTARLTQLFMEYQPEPPYQGSPETAAPADVAHIKGMAAPFLKSLDAAIGRLAK
jgi:putative intracellular protease/amidase